MRRRHSIWKPNNSTPSPITCAICRCATSNCGGIFDFAGKQDRLAEVVSLAEDPAIWQDSKRSQELGRERKMLEGVVLNLNQVESTLNDAKELMEMALAENDDDSLLSIADDIERMEKLVSAMEFRRMFSGEMDANNAFIEIQAGSGGTEAQDWASMLLRMYLRYCERKGFQVEILEQSDGEVAGIKGASLKVTGEYAFGHLRTETGVHRLVRKSPFDSGNRRHTSFSSVFVYPEVDESIEIEINPADLRVDTYRASGAGGQHINKTDSAVRITHAPTGIVVQCQSDRSQHRNRAEAMAMLKSRMYEAELRKRNSEKQAMEDGKTDIGWGHQIRSYVLDQSRIKDLRTNVEIGNTQGVLDGDLDEFIEASLKQGVN
ncbi:MAG: peptide chain release factor 2 [Gallionellales bacterium 35-53-114]|nr:MAG: peptide chain release factor 2 [Gallionellales bacterium 35-53-114]OYZ64859.1 MAG: peptide chain release factor 2 [Gallionellales bacterium 24-53-125]OZB07603.1 MAG: peptide chain release factor 2 [Gallionellales bacterium 39-52-133]